MTKAIAKHATVNSIPTASLVDRALDAAGVMLQTEPHQALTFPCIANIVGSHAPSLYRAFGSPTGFLALLAARQWERATAAIDGGDGSPLGVALADVSFAIHNPHRFSLLYASDLWHAALDDAIPKHAKERTALETMVAARNEHYVRFHYALGGTANENRIRLVASLVTGLSFEFINEKLFQGNRERQLGHAEELLRMVLP